MLIVLEGLDGVGKTTQAKLLKAYIERKGFDVVCDSELLLTSVGRECRELLLNKELPDRSAEVQACLFFAGRLQALQEVIIPKLDQGYIVILDRYYNSTLAMQGAATGNLKLIQGLVKLFKQDLVKPQIYFYLAKDNHDVVNAVKKRGAGTDWFEDKPEDYHNRIQQYFDSHLLEAEWLSTRVDATGTIQQVHKRIREHFDQVFEEKIMATVSL